MKVILPFAGKEIIPETGYHLPIYEIGGKTVAEHLSNHLGRIENAEFVALVLRDDCREYHLDSIIRLLLPDAKIVYMDGMTQGSACTCLLAIDEISDDEPVLIAATNQVFLDDPNKIIRYFEDQEADGGVVIFKDVHPKYSYVKLDENGCVIEAAEKRPISMNATAGFYYFRHGSDFISSAVKMISKNAHVNGKFYLCPVYNEMILEGKKILSWPIARENYFLFKEANGIEDYRKYLRSSND